MKFSEHFETKFLQVSDLEEIVKGIHLAGYVVSDDFELEEDRSPTNHWTLFLELDLEKSVKVDMTPTYMNGEMIGLILLESKNYVMTNKSVKLITFSPKRELRVRDVMEVIMRNGRDRYIFTDDGEGCRFWICVVVKDLEAAEEVGEGSGIVAFRTLGHYWVSPSDGTPREMEEGKFY